ncbi:hypothetical protein LEP1GSC188_2371 [Leptospira weilii serovar Topaz str. LT2116]|uniref:Uncharacterized protein n=1 Tax=Leptospira weilii serovar Topaz str. LT2116 TaxID=1088540 RepID=M3EKV6_9LEPT|nr:hypothetical protein LEP1GSC188_2371 [Leptospira weilii serovar Topaz str. LT2116]
MYLAFYNVCVFLRFHGFLKSWSPEHFLQNHCPGEETFIA